ncbi:MAG: glycerol-3-phosphate 1-O-acyltransferase PlsY [Cyanobacteria bacterium P01_E01_bin.34]
MVVAIALVLSGVVGYVLGSIPTGYWLGRALAGVELRKEGWGSTGATNTLRTLGKGPALFVLVVDLLKGAAAVWAAGVIANQLVFPRPDLSLPWCIILAALLAIVGHSKSIWMNFKGGKSAATSLGILLAMAWPVGLTVLGVWLGTLGLSRIVSISSILAAVAAPILMAVFGQPWQLIAFAAVGGLYVVVRHRGNIQRLMAGTEPRIGQKLQES